ncbi:DUF2637 domain-containing protein [Streptomyces sp. NPDC047980]|uniref:DUF2637 domain-containing protein n=1 Tax=unclassified Streptomyces TaxID=2593676 RepID=UPI00368A85BB
MQLTRTHRILIGVVAAGAVIIAAIGFAGSYTAVRELAENKGFGQFSLVFPIGIDAGICVLLALDLLLTWIRIPFPLLRPTAWLLTAATIAFNGAAAWPDPLGVGMHAVIPILFVVSVEAARHAVGRIADITADKHMEGVRLTRWLLSPVPTFRLWRRMKLWELRSYEQVIKLEQDRLIYQARLQARYGRAWRRKAPIQALMPLRLAKYGIPLAQTAPAGLTAAGITPTLLPPKPATPAPELEPTQPAREEEPIGPAPREEPARHNTPQHTAANPPPARGLASLPGPRTPEDPTPVPAESPDRLHPAVAAALHHPRATIKLSVPAQKPQHAAGEQQDEPDEAGGGTQARTQEASDEARQADSPRPTTVDRYYQAWAQYIRDKGKEPKDTDLSRVLAEHGMTGRGGKAIHPSTLRRYLPGFRIYAAWNEHLQQHGTEPTAQQLSQHLADTGTTGKPYTPEKIAETLTDHPRRHTAINHNQQTGQGGGQAMPPK